MLLRQHRLPRQLPRLNRRAFPFACTPTNLPQPGPPAGLYRLTFTCQATFSHPTGSPIPVPPSHSLPVTRRVVPLHRVHGDRRSLRNGTPRRGPPPAPPLTDAPHCQQQQQPFPLLLCLCHRDLLASGPHTRSYFPCHSAAALYPRAAPAEVTVRSATAPRDAALIPVPLLYTHRTAGSNSRCCCRSQTSWLLPAPSTAATCWATGWSRPSACSPFYHLSEQPRCRRTTARRRLSLRRMSASLAYATPHCRQQQLLLLPQPDQLAAAGPLYRRYMLGNGLEPPVSLSTVHHMSAQPRCLRTAAQAASVYAGQSACLLLPVRMRGAAPHGTFSSV